MTERRITVTVKGMQPIEVSGVVAAMIVLLLARRSEFERVRRGRLRIRFWPEGLHVYGPENDKDAA